MPAEPAAEGTRRRIEARPGIGPAFPRPLSLIGPVMVLVLAVAPSIRWIALDRSVWPFDQAWYGQVSVELLYALVRSPSDWQTQMLHAFSIKAPGIAWLGQLFVPIGIVAGSVETALLAFILVTQLASVILLFVALDSLDPRQRLANLAGCLFVASAPLFVAMSHQYLVEPLQTFSVVWFIAIMVLAPRWSRPTVIVALVAASAVAMLAKVSSPLYCVLPGIATLMALRRTRSEREAVPAKRRPALLLVATLTTGIGALATAGWYVINFDALRQFAIATSSGSVAANYGSAAAFSTKLGYWLTAIQQCFFLPQILIVAGVVFVAGCVSYVLEPRRTRHVSSFDTAAGLAAVQVILVLIAFSFQVNEETRYLLPIAPYLALLTSWALGRLRMLRVTQIVIAAFAVQWVIVYAQALAISPPNSALTVWLRPIETDARHFDDVRAAVATSCTSADVGHYNIVGVELPWFNANSLSFFEAKGLGGRSGPCYYTSLGYAENDPQRAWDRVLTFNIDYFLTVNPALEQIPDDPFNRVAQAVLQSANTSSLFQSDNLPDHPRLLILKHNRTN